MKSAGKGDVGSSSIVGLSSLLTPPQLSKFVQKALPELKLGQASLQQSLKGKQWDAAATQAHKLKSAISLFSAHGLVKSLDAVESGDESIQLSAFRQSLKAQCQQLIDNLENISSSD